MLYLESFVHRVHLAEVVSRWIVNRPDPSDVATIKEIVNFNSFISRIWVDDLAKSILGKFQEGEPIGHRCETKGAFKDFLVQTPHYTNDRIRTLIENYHASPENYFRDSPFDGTIYHVIQNHCPHYVGSTRIKRFRRIAEKGSRQIVDFMFKEIRANADALAEERARRLGITRQQLSTSEEEKVREFLRAEERLLDAIRQGSIQNNFPILSIPDVVGMKVIAEDDDFDRLVDIIRSDDRCSILEIEKHSGRYNATNLRVSYTLPKEKLISAPPTGPALKVFAYRGFDVDQIVPKYLRFIDSAVDHVVLEIIVSNYQEFLESEIGRSIHESRIFEQRANRDFHSHLATNVLYLMDLILTLCLSPHQAPIMDVPIKLWVKYLPETRDRLVRRMFGIPTDASFDGSNESMSDGWQPILAPPPLT